MLDASPSDRRVVALLAAVTLALSAGGAALADIIPLSRTSHVFSQRQSGLVESFQTFTLAPFNAAVTGASQNTSVSVTGFGGSVRNSPFALSTPMHPDSMTATSDFTLNF